MKRDRILLAHGGGGKLAWDLIREVFAEQFSNPKLDRFEDAAVFETDKGRLAFTTDSFVVNPIFFPGGDIGRLAVCGTVNDLSMRGAIPLYLSSSFIIEEGFSIEELKKIVASMKSASSEAGIDIIAGDTKVVEKGSADKLFINTSGVGIVKDGIDISASYARAGDKIILSGYLGDHEIAILSQREGLGLKTDVNSDCAPLNSLVKDMLEGTSNIHCLRDATRGGLAGVLNEIALQSQIGMIINEEKILIRDEVKSVCELLGYDPLYLANEGKLVAIVDKDDAFPILAKMRKNKYGRDAEIIGEVVSEPRGMVLLRTQVGGTRIVDMLVGEQLPRIC